MTEEKKASNVKRIVAALANGPMTARDIAASIGVSAYTVANTLHVYVQRGTVARAGRRGKEMLWRLPEPGDAKTERTGRATSVYLGEDIEAELRTEGARLDRTSSWLLQHAWRIAKEQIKALPGL